MPTLQELQQRNPPDPVDPVLGLEPMPDAEELTFDEIFKRLLAEEEIIITIFAVDEARLRRGLSKKKAHYNAKLRDNNLEPEEGSLEFIVHENAEDVPKDKVRIQILMKKPASIKVFEYKVADGEL